MNIPVLNHKQTLRNKASYKLFIISDLHIGARDFNKEVFIKVMNDNYDECDVILILGDVFDAIFSKDPRYTPGMIAPELAGQEDQGNKAVDMAFNILKPYAKKIQLICKGNHEVAILKHSNFDMLKILTDRLNREAGANITVGGYRGYIHYMFNVGTKKRMVEYSLLYEHGHGGNAPVNKGLTDINRTKVIMEYDGFFFGHKHSMVADIDSYVMVGKNGKVYTKRRISAQVGCFKNLIGTSNDVGFEDLKGFGHSPSGGVMLTLTTRYEDEEYYIDQKITL